jgi:hypothetical protein
MTLEQFANVVREAAHKWSNATPATPVKIKYHTDTQIGLHRGPFAVVLTQTGEVVTVEFGSLDIQTPFKTVPLTQDAAEELGKELGARMRVP